MIKISPAAVFVAATLLSGCGPKDGRAAAGDVLVTMGDSVLTRQDVVSRIPQGIAPEDSAALFHAVVDGWVERMVLDDMAREKLPELPEIDRMVEEYRSRLIVAEYLRRMVETNGSVVDEGDIRKFYDANKADLVNEVPLVKGIYLKVPEGADNIADIRRCMRGASEQDIDELETRWSVQTVKYDYFADDWIDWTSLSDNIPYRFGDAQAFLSANRDFETSYNGSVHFLHIIDWMPPGSVMPYEYARPIIASMLERSESATYRETLVKSLIKKAVDNGSLTSVSYDLFKHRNTEFNDTIRQ